MARESKHTPGKWKLRLMDSQEKQAIDNSWPVYRNIIIGCLLVFMALFASFIGGMMLSDHLRSNATQLDDTLHWHHKGDTVRLDVSKLEDTK